MSTFNVDDLKGVLSAYSDFCIRVQFAFSGILPPRMDPETLRKALDSSDPIGFIRTEFFSSTCHTIEHFAGTPTSPAEWRFTNEDYQREFRKKAPSKIINGPFAESMVTYFFHSARPVPVVFAHLVDLRARFGFSLSGMFAEGNLNPKTSTPFKSGGLEFLVAISSDSSEENGQRWCENLSCNPAQLAANVDRETGKLALQDLTSWIGTIQETGEGELQPPEGWTLVRSGDQVILESEVFFSSVARGGPVCFRFTVTDGRLERNPDPEFGWKFLTVQRFLDLDPPDEVLNLAKVSAKEDGTVLLFFGDDPVGPVTGPQLAALAGKGITGADDLIRSLLNP